MKYLRWIPSIPFQDTPILPPRSYINNHIKKGDDPPKETHKSSQNEPPRENDLSHFLGCLTTRYKQLEETWITHQGCWVCGWEKNQCPVFLITFFFKPELKHLMLFFSHQYLMQDNKDTRTSNTYIKCFHHRYEFTFESYEQLIKKVLHHLSVFQLQLEEALTSWVFSASINRELPLHLSNSNWKWLQPSSIFLSFFSKEYF